MSFTNSTFLDAYGANLYTTAQYNALAGGSTAPLAQLFSVGATAPTVSGALSGTGALITVGLVLDRASDPGALLSGNWAQRQAAISTLSAAGGPFSTYGADQQTYNNAVSTVSSTLGGSASMTAASSTGYVSSAADRTIWVTLSADGFAALFGQSLHRVDYTYGLSDAGTPQGYNVYAWTGSLTLPSALSSVVSGLWLEQNVAIPNPNILNGTLVPPAQGPQGIGNATSTQVNATPAAIAANYSFPLASDIATAPIALVETNINNQAGLFAAYNQYRQQVGLQPVTAAQFQVLSGTNTAGQIIGELSLDISVIAGAAPNSSQLIYSDLGGTPYNAYQQIFFDQTHKPAVLTSSYPITGQATANSPFMWAWKQLFVDGVLANVSVHMAGGDEGASDSIANGVVNLGMNHASPFTLLVGGTSISGLYSAATDKTLADMLALALHDDPATVAPMVAAGLKTLPSSLSAAAPSPVTQATTLETLFETVWQSLFLSTGRVNGQRVLESAYGAHETGSGGVSLTTAIPSYQMNFGLSALTGGLRGAPDVAALSSGDTSYAVLFQDYVNGLTSQLVHGDGGTSAAAPLWASLTAQFNAIFHDQGLPNLGYYNDLLYIAAVIAPGSFNDVQLGDNINSFTTSATNVSGYYNTQVSLYMTPTGQGYAATPGYDLASGLGTPNGTLLARALTAIAHQQVSFASSPALLDDDGHGGWLSGADQSLLLQATTPSTSVGIGVLHGGQTLAFASSEPGSFAWSARLAQQALQPDFDPGLAVLFDRQAQGAEMHTLLHDGESLAVSLGSTAGQAMQAALSNPFGFADFFSGDETLRVARPVAVAETVGGLSDQLAVVRLRQVGSDSLALTVYRVDDLAGTIAGAHPGDAGYAAAAQGRAYVTGSGTTSIGGPGYGQFGEAVLQHVNAGDLVAFVLTNNSSGQVFYGFTAANETVAGQKVAHLWNYGLNTWGFEDTWGGGDHDFNDLVVQIDFNSASGHGWLV